MSGADPVPLATNAVRRVRDAARTGGRVTAAEVTSLAAEVLRHRRDQRKRVAAAGVLAGQIADGVAPATPAPPVRPGPPRRPPPPAEQMRAGIEAYRAGANVTAVAGIMGVSGHVARRLLIEAGVQLRRGRQAATP